MRNRSSSVAVAVLAGAISSASATRLYPTAEPTQQSVASEEHVVTANYSEGNLADGRVYYANRQSLGNVSNMDATFSLDIAVPALREWNHKSERRFKALAIKEATQNLTRDEQIEQSSLQELRDSKAYPASPEEVIHRYRMNTLTENLIAALNEYVEFIASAPETKNTQKRKS